MTDFLGKGVKLDLIMVSLRLAVLVKNEAVREEGRFSEQIAFDPVDAFFKLAALSDEGIDEIYRAVIDFPEKIFQSLVSSSSAANTTKKAQQ